MPHATPQNPSNAALLVRAFAAEVDARRALRTGEVECFAAWVAARLAVLAEQIDAAPGSDESAAEGEDEPRPARRLPRARLDELN
jgi:hypothetical protein